MQSLPTSDPPLRHLEVAGHAVTVTDGGEGPTLLLVHGLPGSVRDFRYLEPHLVGVRTVRVDMPGFGGTSRQRRRTWTPEQRAAFLGGVVDALGLGPLVVAGHSMGGVVATALAVQRPDRVAGVALLASPGVREHRGFVGSNVRVLGRVLAVPGAGRLLRRNVRKGFVRAGFPRSTPDREMVAALIDASALDFAQHEANLKALDVPTMLAWADDDKLVEPAIGEQIAALVPEGPRLRWTSGGHNIQKTHAAELGEALVQFVRRTPWRDGGPEGRPGRG